MSFLRQRLTGSANPDDPQRGSGRHGGTGDRFKSGEHATVIAFDSNTFSSTIRTERGAVKKGVPCLRSSPGELAPLPVGTEVLVSYEYGLPIIMGCLSLPSTNNENTPTHSVSDVDGYGGQGLNKSNLPEGNYRRPGEPTDLIPGDWAKVGADGNSFALLGGGTTLVKAGPLSQMRFHQINDLVELLSRNFRHITDMGEFNVTNDDGRINMSFRGASDQRNEAGPDEEHWTIRMDAGAVGDIFNLEFTTTKGQTLFKFHVDASGHCEIFGVNGVNIASGSRNSGTHTEEHSGDSTSSVGGNRSTTVQGTETRAYGNTVTETIGGNYESTINNDLRQVAIRDMSLSAGRTMFLNVLGSAIPVSPAATFDIQNGSWEINLGQPLSIPFTSGFNLTAHNSDIKHKIIGPGDIINETRLGRVIDTSLAHFIDTSSIPNSIVLGGSTPIGENIVKWQSLVLYLQALHAALNTHVHPITGTATAGPFPVVGVTTPPLPIFDALATMFELFRSKVALVTI